MTGISRGAFVIGQGQTSPFGKFRQQEGEGRIQSGNDNIGPVKTARSANAMGRIMCSSRSGGRRRIVALIRGRTGLQRCQRITQYRSKDVRAIRYVVLC